MRHMSRVVIGGLFGSLSHDIKLRSEEPTILTGPNGVGKTTVLILICAALELKVHKLIAGPFASLDIYLDDGTQLSIKRNLIGDKPPRIRIAAKIHADQLGAAYESDGEDAEDQHDIPPWIERVNENRWLDRRHGTTISTRLLEARYGVRVTPLSRGHFQDYPEIRSCVAGLQPILIDTKRLDTLVGDQSRTFLNEPNPRSAPARIQQYINQIRAQVEEARRTSVVATQSADLSFASRALAAAHVRVREAALHKRYDEIVEQYEDLSNNGLAIGEAPLDFPDNTTPTIRRILNVFLDDWENRLEPLRPVNSKVKLLRRILDGKLSVTGKTTRITERGLLRFIGPQGNAIQVSKLSSGEQHLIALFAMLLFSAGSASVVLVDEPEISLHAAWKHSFLDDISEVARLVNLQVVLATHSSGVINGRWDLTEELSYRVAAAIAVPEEDSDRESAAEDDFE